MLKNNKFFSFFGYLIFTYFLFIVNIRCILTFCSNYLLLASRFWHDAVKQTKIIHILVLYVLLIVYSISFFRLTLAGHHAKAWR